MLRWSLGIVAVALLFGMIGFGPRALGQALPTPRGQLGGKEPLEPSPSPPAPPPPIVLPSPASPPLAPNAGGVQASTATVSGTPEANATVTSQPAASIAAAKASTVTLSVRRGNDGRLASGWVFDASGHVVTSARAVDGADWVEAIAPDGRRGAASTVAADELSGVAVLAAPDLALPPLPLADADAVAGETVLAAGTAGEGLAGTVSQGIVSSDARWLPDAYAATPLLLHDAAVAPAMAGGPLLNAAGEVVGMIVPVDDERGEDGTRLPGLDDDAGEAAAPARSFAVPVSTLRAVVPALVERGRVERPWFGVGVVPVTAEEASGLGLPAAAGVVVAVVAPESPAAAGIAEGDVIVAVDSEPLTPERGFAAALAGRAAGETVAVQLLRQGTEQTVEVTLGEAPQAG